MFNMFLLIKITCNKSKFFNSTQLLVCLTTLNSDSELYNNICILSSYKLDLLHF